MTELAHVEIERIVAVVDDCFDVLGCIRHPWQLMVTVGEQSLIIDAFCHGSDCAALQDEQDGAVLEALRHLLIVMGRRIGCRVVLDLHARRAFDRVARRSA